MNWVSVVGALAAAITSFQFFPQVRHTWRQRRDAEALAGVSLPTFSILISSAVLWIAYGIGQHDPVILVPNVMCFSAVTFTFLIVFNGRRRIRTA